MNKISKEMLNAMQGVIPSPMATASLDGIPNVTYVSQVFFLDENRVGLSWQFMKKSWENISVNPAISVILTDPNSIKMWELRLLFTELSRSGPLFEEMDMQLYAISKLFVQTEHFKLKAVLICEVVEIIVLSNGG